MGSIDDDIPDSAWRTFIEGVGCILMTLGSIALSLLGFYGLFVFFSWALGLLFS